MELSLDALHGLNSDGSSHNWQTQRESLTGMPLVFVRDLFAGAVEVTGSRDTASSSTHCRASPSPSDTDFLRLVEHLWHIPSHKDSLGSAPSTSTSKDGTWTTPRPASKSTSKPKTIKAKAAVTGLHGALPGTLHEMVPGTLGGTLDGTVTGTESVLGDGMATATTVNWPCSSSHQLSASTVVEDLEQGLFLQLAAQNHTRDPRWQKYCHSESQLLQSLMRLETNTMNFQSLIPSDMAMDAMQTSEVADTCPLCSAPLCIEVTLSLSVCCNCGWAQEHMDSSTTVLVFSEASYDFSNPLTRRSNHFDTWISALQGKDKNLPPPAVLKQIMWQLRASNVAPSEVSTLTVQMALRKLRLRKYYDRVQVILCYLTNQGAPQLTLQQELQVKLLFTAASNSFQRNTPEMRRNMIAYSVVLHCICIFLGLNLFKQSFVPMRSREKLNKQAQYMLRICLDLGWNYNILRRELFEQQVQAIEAPKKGSSPSAVSGVTTAETATPKPKGTFQQLRLDMTPVPHASPLKETAMPTNRPMDTLSCIESEDEEDDEDIAAKVLPMEIDSNDDNDGNDEEPLPLPPAKRSKRESVGK